MKMLGLVIIQIGISIITTFLIIEHIEKHSVHPIYGNYTKVDSNGIKCQPWDSCK